MATPDDRWHPTVPDLLALHEEIVAEHDESEPGVRDEAGVEFAVERFAWGQAGDDPASLHEAAVDLLRLLAANHPFVDGNKRTALNATAVFLAANGHRFDYGHDVRVILKLLGVREDLLDRTAAAEYVDARTTADPPAASDENSLAASADSGAFGDPSRETLLEISRRDRERHREVYDALAEE